MSRSHGLCVKQLAHKAMSVWLCYRSQSLSRRLHSNHSLRSQKKSFAYSLIAPILAIFFLYRSSVAPRCVFLVWYLQPTGAAWQLWISPSTTSSCHAWPSSSSRCTLETCSPPATSLLWSVILFICLYICCILRKLLIQNMLLLFISVF